MNKVLITGANGFIGDNLCKKLLYESFRVRGVVRPGKGSMLPNRVEVVHVESIDGDTSWKNAFAGVDTVVHLAAQVHIIKDSVLNSLTEYRKVNVKGTERLAREAVIANVKRFIYMSSVKVNGEGRSTPYHEEDTQQPQDAYSISKWEAEKVLNKISRKTGMEVVIIRSPLVYGPRVKANFLRLLKVVERGIPLPLASVNNRRSMIYLGNLVDAIVTCMKHPKAAGQTYFVSDGKDVSTPELIRRISTALGRSVILFPLPSVMLKMAGVITGRSVAIDRLLSSLMVDSSKFRYELDWRPPFTIDQGLRETAQWYLKENFK